MATPFSFSPFAIVHWAAPLRESSGNAIYCLEIPLPAALTFVHTVGLPPTVCAFSGPGARHPRQRWQSSFGCSLSLSGPSPRHVRHCVSDEPFKFAL